MIRTSIFNAIKRELEHEYLMQLNNNKNGNI